MEDKSDRRAKTTQVDQESQCEICCVDLIMQASITEKVCYHLMAVPVCDRYQLYVKRQQITFLAASIPSKVGNRLEL